VCGKGLPVNAGTDLSEELPGGPVEPGGDSLELKQQLHQNGDRQLDLDRFSGSCRPGDGYLDAP
jgi:hypothetical protein